MNANPGKTPRQGKIQTVLGLIEPDALGPTLMHEHLLIDLTPPPSLLAGGPAQQEAEITLCNCWGISNGQKSYLKNYQLDQIDVAVEEVGDMMDAGGRAIVDLTNGGLKPDPLGLVEIARRTGAHIVMGCGHYVHAYQDPANHERTVDSFTAEMVAQLTRGAWGTDVCAGIIGEIGCQSPWTDVEKRVMRGALIAQSETGAAINVHPGRHPDQPAEIVSFIQAAGHGVERVIISHVDRTIFDDDRLLRLADTGCVIEFDLFGWEQSYYPMSSEIDMPNDGARLKMARLLVARGHRDQVLLSQDICTRTRLGRYGGHGYQHMFANIAPRMLQRGFSQEDVDAILVENPRRLLTIR
ncbi:MULTISPECIES: phosphotriesterase family protein [Cupriavidus]